MVNGGGGVWGVVEEDISGHREFKPPQGGWYFPHFHPPRILDFASFCQETLVRSPPVGAMVSTRHAKVEDPEPGSSTRSGKRPKEPTPETSPGLLAHEMLSASSPVAGTSHGVVYTPQLYDGMAASSCTPMYETGSLLPPDAMVSSVTPTITTIPDLVRLCVTGLPDSLPRIGELEAAFLAGGRVRKVWRIELQEGAALVDVERFEVANCLGAVELGQLRLEVEVSDTQPASHTEGRKRPKTDEGGKTAKERREYRQGVSYRCGRCGKPKKGHVCDLPEEGCEVVPGTGDSPFQPGSMTATTSPPAGGTAAALLAAAPQLAPQSREVQAIATAQVARACASSPGAASQESPGQATAVFKDMVAALGDESMPASVAKTPAAAAAGLTDMDMMLADLAFAARPPPVITPDESAMEVPSGVGSLSPSMLSPSTMINQLLGTPTPGGAPSVLAGPRSTRSALSATTKSSPAAEAAKKVSPDKASPELRSNSSARSR